VTEEQLVRLRAYEKKKLQITCLDGELIQAEVLHVDDENRDVVCELLSTTTPEKYKQGKGICIAVNWDDISDLQEISN
jgi:hypothetical protein